LHTACPPAAALPPADDRADAKQVAGLALQMGKASTEDTLRLAFDCYLAKKGKPVDGTGQLGPDELHSVLQVSEGLPGGWEVGKGGREC